MSNDNSSSIYAGGIVVVVVVIGLCMKMLQKLFVMIGQTFDAFGNMAFSFVTMTWQVLLALALITVGIGCVVGAIYFTYKYYMMVKRGTEIREEVELRLENFLSQLNTIIKNQHQQNEHRLKGVELRISEVQERQEMLLNPPVPKLLISSLDNRH